MPLSPASKSDTGLPREAQSLSRHEALAWAEVDGTLLPRHIAFIMDGNGRWARARQQPRTFGHAQGVQRVRPLIERCGQLGIEVLTFYSFSTENWRRSPEEVNYLMDLCVRYLIEEADTMVRNEIRVVHLGQREGLPASVVHHLDEVVARTAAGRRMTVCMALNYGSRAEITHAVRRLAREVKAATLDPEAITSAMISDALDTRGLPDPDLMIRTAGEMRLSNYLLWQLSYAELYVTEACWPDFSLEHLRTALQAFAQRRRKFGAEDPATPAPEVR